MATDRLSVLVTVVRAQESVAAQGWVGTVTLSAGSVLALIALFRRWRATLLHSGRAQAGEQACKGEVAHDRDQASTG